MNATSGKKTEKKVMRAPIALPGTLRPGPYSKLDVENARWEGRTEPHAEYCL